MRRLARASVCVAALLVLLAGALTAATRPGEPLADENWIEAAVKAARQGRTDSNVVVFVVDSPPEDWFVDGGLPPLLQANYMPSHGSLVGRVIRQYCSSAIVAVPVMSAGEGVDHMHYVVELFRVLQYVESHPQDRVLVNVSLGSYARDPIEEAVVAKLLKAGALVIAAAGNDGLEQPMYPAAYKGVVAVACATSDGKIASSNYGPHIAAAATGDITFIDYDFLPQSTLRREMHVSGTSFAAPEVTAMLAFALEHNPRMSPSEALVKLCSTLVPLRDKLFKDGKLGGGYLSIARAKWTISPFYGARHYVLPIVLLIVGVVAAIYAIARWKWWGVAGAAGGLFAATVACMLIFLGWEVAARFFPRVTPASPWVYVLNLVGLAAIVLIRRGKVGGAMAVWIGVMLASLGLKLGGVEAIPRAVFVVAACTAWALVLDVPVLLLIRRIRVAPQTMSAQNAAEYLYGQYHACWDEPRVRRAAHVALNTLPAADTDEFLVRVGRPGGVVMTSVRSIRKSEWEKMERERMVQETLSQVVTAREAQPLLAALAHEDRRVRVAAARALQRLKDPGALDALIAALKDGEYTVREATVGALAELRDARSVEPLIAMLKDDVYIVRGAAARALGGSGDARAVEPLRAALGDADGQVRRVVHEALRRLGAGPAAAPVVGEAQVPAPQAPSAGGQGARAGLDVERLAAALQDDPAFRQVMDELHARVAEMVENCIPALGSDSAEVRQAAVQALKALSGEDFGEDAEKWRAWWQENKTRYAKPPTDVISDR